MTYDDLSPEQRKLFDQVNESVIWGEGTIGGLVTAADASDEDKADVLDAFEPGAGAVFRR